MTALVDDATGGLRLHRTFDSFGNITSETHYDANGDAVTEGQTGYVDEAFAYTGHENGVRHRFCHDGVLMVSSAHGTTAASRRGWVCLSRVESGQRADDDL